MNGRDIVSVLNFSAFRPEPDDPSASWKKRYPKTKTLMLNIGKNALGWRSIKANGRMGDGGIIRGELKDTLTELTARLTELTENGVCAVSLNTRYVISLEANLSRRAGSEEALKSNPRSVLGARYERGKRYAVTHNPETNSSVLLTCDEEQIRKLEAQLKENGLKVNRICCGTYILLRHAFSLTHTNPKVIENPPSYFYVVCCQGAVCALVQNQDNWLELRSRPDVYDDDLTPLVDLLTPFQARLSAEVEIVLVCDEPMPKLVEKMKELFRGNKITDLTQPELLWTILLEN